MLVTGFDQVISKMDRSLITAEDCPRELRNHGLLEFLSFNKKCNASSVYNKLKADNYKIYAGLQPNWQLKILSNNIIPKLGQRKLVLGASNGGSIENCVVPLRINWKNNKPALVLKEVFTPEQARVYFESQSLSCFYLATGGIHFLPGNIFEDLLLNGQKSIWADEWKKLKPTWISYFHDLKFAGINPDLFFIDHEIKWNHGQTKQKEQLTRSWIAQTCSDPRWPEVRERLGFDVEDLTQWEHGSEKALRWSEVQYERGCEIERTFSEAVWEVWSDCKVNWANSEYKAPSTYGTLRTPPIGVGAVAGNVVALKAYGVNRTILPGQTQFTGLASDNGICGWEAFCGEIRLFGGAIAASHLPLAVWPQDNSDNFFVTSPYYLELLRHACLLSEEPFTVSVEGGLVRESIINFWKKAISEADDICGNKIGKPLVPDSFGQNPWYVLTGMDIGDRIVWRLSLRPDTANKVSLEFINGSSRLSLGEDSVIIPCAKPLMKYTSPYGCWLESIK